MISLIYTIASTIVFWLFSMFMQITTDQLIELRNNQFKSLNDQMVEDQEATESANPKYKPSFLADKIVVERIDDDNLSENNASFGSENYVVEPIGEGFYSMKNVPKETMSTVDELNDAVNMFRNAHGYQKLEIDHWLCEFADFRAHEIEGNFTHDGFSQYIKDGKADEYGFTHFGENIWTGSMMGVHIVEYGWAKSPGHFAALVGDWTKGCGGIYGENAVFIFAR